MEVFESLDMSEDSSVSKNLYELAIVPHVLRRIHSFLTCEESAQMRCVDTFSAKHILKHTIVRVKAFQGTGLYRDKDDLLTPDPVFLTLPIQSLKLSCRWKDQGWGNRKGDIILKIVEPMSHKNDEPILVYEQKRIFGIAAHEWTTPERRLNEDDAIVRKADVGNLLQFFRHIGGGGGHELFVEDFRCVITWKYD